MCFSKFFVVAQIAAGWSSPVARQAHNLKVLGSNPSPATSICPISLNRLMGYSPDDPTTSGLPTKNPLKLSTLPVSQRNMKLPELFKEFTNYAILERCLEPTTILWYDGSIKCFYKYLRRRVIPANLEVLTTETLRDFLISQRQLGNSPRTILNLIRAIKAFCTYLVKRNYLAQNPFDKLEKPKISRKLPEFLDEEEARQLLMACMDMKRIYKSQWYRDIAIVAMFLFTGIRKKELLNLKLQDLNLERAYIKVSAKNKERLVPLNETVVEFLKDYLKVRPERTVDNIFVMLPIKQGEFKLELAHWFLT